MIATFWPQWACASSWCSYWCLRLAPVLPAWPVSSAARFSRSRLAKTSASCSLPSSSSSSAAWDRCRLQPEPAGAAPLSGLDRADFGNPAAWAVALLLVIMPLIANGFFLIEIFGTTMILGIVALSLMFLAGYGGMVSLMQLTIAGLAGYMTAVL